MFKKKGFAAVLCIMLTMVLTACGNSDSDEITVVSREDGSGTRGAFVEVVGIVDEEGNDVTTLNAEITNSTSVVIQSVIGNVNSVGYISIGALSDDVKALKIDGAEATAENVKNGSYKIARPFNIVETKDVSEQAEDFINFMLSNEGQAAVKSSGFIALDGNGPYKKGNVEGKVVVAGSTSVGPVMEVLAQEYCKLNPNVEIEIQQTGSSAGIEAAIAGACDIGMASRDLKDSEIAKGLKPTVIALDGIAIIINNENKCDSLELEKVKKIFTGEIENWSDEEITNE